LAASYLARLEVVPQATTALGDAVDWACGVSLLTGGTSDPSSAAAVTVATDVVRRAEQDGKPWSASIPPRTWSFVIDRLRDYDGITVALAAFKANRWEVAARAAEHTATTVEAARAPASLLVAVALMLNEGASARVRAHLERAITSGEGAIARDASLILASLLIDAGELREAERVIIPYEEVQDEHPRTAVRILQASIALGSGKVDRAEAYVRTILEGSLSPTNAVSVAALLLQMTERIEASQIDRLVRPLLESPEILVSSTAHAVLGFTAFVQGKIDEARAHLTAARRDGPPFIAGRACSGLGWLALVTGGLVEAETLLREAVRPSDPFTSANAALGLGVLLMARQQRDAARLQLEEAVRIGPPRIRRQAVFQLGVLTAAGGDAAGAAALLEAHADEPDAAPAMAQVAALSGDLERARRYYHEPQLLRLSMFEQLLIVQQGLLAADQPRRIDAAELLLEPFTKSPVAVLSHLSTFGLAICAMGRRALDRAEELLATVAQQAAGGLALRAPLAQAEVALRRGDPDEAERRATALSNEPGIAARAALVLGGTALVRVDKAGARAWYARAAEVAIDEEEIAAQARLQLVSLALVDGDLSEAERLCRHVASSKHPDIRAAAFNCLSLIALQQKRLPEALQHVEVALKLDPDDTMVLARRALVAESMGETRLALESAARIGDLAERHLNQLLVQFPPGSEHMVPGGQEVKPFLDLARRDPSAAVRQVQAEGAIARARLLQGDGRSAEAGAELERAMQLAPRSATPWILRGEWRRLDGRFEEALDDFDHILTFEPGSAVALGSRGQVLRALGREAAARAAFDRALELTPGLPWVRWERAAMRFEEGDRDGAANDLAEAEVVDPTFRARLLSEAVEALNKEAAADAITRFGLYRLLDPDHAMASMGLALALAASRRDADALAEFDHALGLAPGDAVIFTARGDFHSERWDMPAALEDYQRAVVSNPEDAMAVAKTGVTLGQLGRDADAIARLNEAVNLAPDDTWVRMQRAVQYRRAGRFAESAADLDRCLAAAPDSWDFQTLRAETAVAAGDHERAISLLDRLIEHGGGSMDWNYFLRGLVYHALGGHGQAAHDFADAARVSAVATPATAMARFNQALYYLASGKPTEAIAVYSEMVPSSPEALLRTVLADLLLLERWGPLDPVAGGQIVEAIRSRLPPAASA
jgi:tetratricopeptide (TPR) repeat protein